MSRLNASLAFAAAFLLSAGAAAQPATAPSPEIAMWRYDGFTPGSSKETLFEEFRVALERKLRPHNLQPMLLRDASAYGDTVANLGNLFVNYHGSHGFDRPSVQVPQWLASQGSILSGLCGAIFTGQDGYIVESDFYFADPGYLNRNLVVVELPVKPEELSTTLDTHTLVVLYALAVDAQRRGLPTADLAAILTAAKSMITDIERRLARPLSDDLAAIKSAIQQAEQEILGDAS